MSSDKRIFVIGHKANFKGNNGAKRYVALQFLFNPKSKKYSTPKIIAERGDFPESKAKLSTLKNVVFPAGTYKDPTDSSKSNFYCGISDRYVGVKPLN